MTVAYEDLFDIEKRPGAGAAFWTRAVEMQLARVRDANYRHRLNNGNEQEKRDDADAEDQLHADVYFLTLAIRRVLLFHDVFAKQVGDPRLAAARAKFDVAAPQAKVLRDLYEHIDEYLLDNAKKHLKIAGRAAPVLRCRWDSDNVVACIGPIKVDVTLAALAAIELGRASARVWDEHLDRARPQRPLAAEGGRVDETMSQVLAVTVGVSTIIGNEDDSKHTHTGVLLGVEVQDATGLADRMAPRYEER